MPWVLDSTLSAQLSPCYIINIKQLVYCCVLDLEYLVPDASFLIELGKIKKFFTAAINISSVSILTIGSHSLC